MKYNKKILLTSYLDNNGAGKSALKLHNFFLQNKINSTFLTYKKTTNIKSHIELEKNRVIYCKSFFNRSFNKFLNIYPSINYKSYSPLSLNISQSINRMNVDIVQLNWVNFFLNYKDINKIEKPIVWRLSDLWPISGVTHFNTKNYNIFDNFDLFLDNFFFKIKFRYLRNDLVFISPTKWVEKKIKENHYFKNSYVETIQTPISKKNFKYEKKIFREKNTLLFSSIGGISDRRKGFQILLDALKIISKQNVRLKIYVLSNDKKKIIEFFNHKIIFLGLVQNTGEINDLYNKVTATIIPSIIDNLPQVGLESQMCGTPIITFDKPGLSDLVVNKSSGFLAKYRDTESLSKKIIECINSKINNAKISNDFDKNNDDQKIIDKYLNTYDFALNKFKRKVLYLSSTDSIGGATKATNKIVRSLNYSDNFEVNIFAFLKHSNSPNVLTQRYINSLYNKASYKLGSLYNKLLRILGYQNYLSLNITPSFINRYLENYNFSIIDVHWVGNEGLSFYDLSKIKNKIFFFTFHDQWIIRGVSHYNKKTSKSISPKVYPLFFKKFFFKNKDNIYFITPTKWLKNEISNNSLLSGIKTFHIRYPIDNEIFKPMNHSKAKANFSISTKKKIILFGALGANKDKRKGFHHLKKILNNLNKKSQYLILTFGSKEKIIFNGFEVINLGIINSENQMRFAYNCANVMIVPSEIDNLPQTALEAQSCGIPVITFDNYGMKETIAHNKTGYLVKQYNYQLFAKKIKDILKPKIQNKFKKNARIRAINLWDPKLISSKITNSYDYALKKRIY